MELLNSKPARQSNFELLRIIAMLMVMVHHANFWRIGRPDLASLMSAPIASLVRIATQTFSDPCVDVFIIISGYFAIRPKFKSLLNLWFLLSFWVVFELVWKFCWHEIPVRGSDIMHVLFPFYGWFISAYLGLYLISPILNEFAEHFSPDKLLKYIILLIILQFAFDIVYPAWDIFGRTIFNGGR